MVAASWISSPTPLLPSWRKHYEGTQPCLASSYSVVKLLDRLDNGFRDRMAYLFQRRRS